jgi:hypothetical protein
MTTWRNLDAYMTWVLAQPFDALRVGTHEMYHLGSVVAFTLHRAPPFQTELVLLLPTPGGHVVVDHAHPSVDGREVILHGEVHFTIDGVPLYPERLIRRFASKLLPFKVPPLIVPAGTIHGATVGPEGGAFLSIQEWLPGSPPMSTVGLDWTGAPMDDRHARALEAV